jgi:hypothetical protein
MLTMMTCFDRRFKVKFIPLTKQLKQKIEKI